MLYRSIRYCNEIYRYVVICEDWWVIIHLASTLSQPMVWQRSDSWRQPTTHLSRMYQTLTDLKLLIHVMKDCYRFLTIRLSLPIIFEQCTFGWRDRIEQWVTIQDSEYNLGTTRVSVYISVQSVHITLLKLLLVSQYLHIHMNNKNLCPEYTNVILTLNDHSDDRKSPKLRYRPHINDAKKQVKFVYYVWAQDDF